MMRKILGIFTLIFISAYSSAQQYDPKITGIDDYFILCVSDVYAKHDNRFMALNECERRRQTLIHSGENFDFTMGFLKGLIDHPEPVVIYQNDERQLQELKAMILEIAFRQKNASYYVQKTFENLINGDEGGALKSVSEADYAVELLDDEISRTLESVKRAIGE